MVVKIVARSQFLGLRAAQFGSLVFSSAVFGRGESGGRTGCLFMAVGAPLFQSFTMSVFVAFYLSMMLGGTDITSRALVLSVIWPLFKGGLVAVIAVGILCIVPVLGTLIVMSPAIQNFLLGVIVFRLGLGHALAEASAHFSLSTSLYPGVWSTIGYLIIAAAVLIRVILYGCVLISVVTKNRVGSELAEAIPLTLAPRFAVLGGLLPLFMNVQHVRLAVDAATRT
jgi:hypothetical protein